MTDSQKLKSDKLKVELKTLKDENALLLEKVETLTSSNIMLNKSIIVLNQKLNEISTSDEVKKDLWKRKLMAEKISVEKELIKRFVPPKWGLGYVEIPNVPSSPESHGNVPIFHDKKISQLYEKLHNSKDQGIDFQKRKKQKFFRPGHSKYANILDHHVCWHCGNAGHYRHSCLKHGHTWHGVPSNVRVNVQVPSKKKFEHLR